jgi:small conductance mechanosensitive channel
MVDIFSTTLKHPDRSRVIIPNRKIIGEILHNFGTIRQLHLSVDVTYQTDLTQALTIVQDLIAGHPHVLKDPAPSIGVSHLGHPAVTIAIEPWTLVVHYASLQGELNKAIIERFRAVHIEFPAPLFTIRLTREPAWPHPCSAHDWGSVSSCPLRPQDLCGGYDSGQTSID